MDGWLLLDGRLQQRAGEVLVRMTRRKLIHSVVLLLLVSHTVLQMCQNSKVTPHGPQTGENLKQQETRDMRAGLWRDM